MKKFFKIAQKIPQNFLQIIFLLAFVMAGSIGFQVLIKKQLLETTLNKFLLLTIVLIVVVLLFAIEKKYLLTKVSDNLTKEEVEFYLKANYLIVAIVFLFFAFLLFFFSGS